MIKLTGTSDESIWINPEMVESVGHSSYYKGTVVVMSGTEMDETPIVVTETPEEVVRKIINYKTSVIDFTSHSAGVVRVLIDHDLDVYKDMVRKYESILEYAGLKKG